MLLRDADAAMYQAKRSGRRLGGHQLFDAGVRQHAASRREMESELSHALTRNEFALAYQPLVSLTDEARLIGFQALVQWQHPTRGPLDADAFAAAAEHTHLTAPIGRWALNEACRQVAEWNADRDPSQALTVALNVSDHQLRGGQMHSDVVDCLARHALNPCLLRLDVTENALRGETAPATVLESLSALGVRLAADAFGTGYSSLGHLRRYPVNVLKIDRSLVLDLEEDDAGAAMIAAITSVARALGMVAIAGGIDTPRQLDKLRRLGCDGGLGNALARPMTATEATASLQR
jgi:EAL domain-containing protein (putative c-di-GMP-specific phosphodiesterase class I)